MSNQEKFITEAVCPQCQGDGFVTAPGKEGLFTCPACHGERFVLTCAAEGCAEAPFREGLCFSCFIGVKTQEWDDHLDEVNQAHLVSVGMG